MWERINKRGHTSIIHVHMWSIRILITHENVRDHRVLRTFVYDSARGHGVQLKAMDGVQRTERVLRKFTYESARGHTVLRKSTYGNAQGHRVLRDFAYGMLYGTEYIYVLHINYTIQWHAKTMLTPQVPAPPLAHVHMMLMLLIMLPRTMRLAWPTHRKAWQKLEYSELFYWYSRGDDTALAS